MALLNKIDVSLLPPILPTFLEPSIITDELFIYFEIPSTILSLVPEPISRYQCEVSIREQESNQSVLATEQLIKSIQFNNQTNRYYVKVEESELKEKKTGSSARGFLRNRYYKVQLRFCEENYSMEKLFSEWSSVALFKCIDKPVIVFNEPSYQYNILGFNFIDIYGQLFFYDEAGQPINSNETLKSYKFSLKDGTGKVVEQSNTLFSENFANDFRYSFKTRIDNTTSQSYVIILNYETSSGYKGLYEQNFEVKNIEEAYCSVKFKAKVNNTAAAIQFQVDDLEASSDFFEEGNRINFTIKRSSILTRFTVWEDINQYSFIYYQDMMPSLIPYKWTDLTVENGVWYQYVLQVTVIKNGRQYSQIFDCQKDEEDMGYTLPDIQGYFFMVDFQELFLVDNNHQLKIKFNPKITSYSKKTTETVVDTIGGQYPFIRRNGTVNYKTLSISGLISIAAEDYQEAFLSSVEVIQDSRFNEEEPDAIFQGLDLSFYNRENRYKDYTQLYNLYNINNNINQDVFLETEYREKVLDFLTNSSFKLLKTPNNRNLLVKLMDVRLEPEDTLGGFLYSFSATAYQVDSTSIVNCDKYNIQPIEQTKNKISYALFVESYDNLTEVSLLEPMSYNETENETFLVLNPVIEQIDEEDDNE